MVHFRPEYLVHFTPVQVVHIGPESLVHFAPVEVVHYTPVCSCYTDPATGKIYEFITNNMKLAATTIAEIYKSRWKIELFFKWIKQNLKIKSFLGTSKNAVLTQIWVAMCYYLLLSYIKFQTKYHHTLQELTRMIAAVLMEQRLLIDILSLNEHSLKKVRVPVSQLALF